MSQCFFQGAIIIRNPMAESILLHILCHLISQEIIFFLIFSFSADEDKSFGGNLDRLNTRVILNFDGTTVWLAPVILKSKCEINVKHFPFDEQKCKMKFGSWTYDEQRLNLVPENYTADLSK